MESDYKSVTEQAGIYAGNEGFDITVGKETILKGAVIDSGAEESKNVLSTGTLSYPDIENSAAYRTGGFGAAYHQYSDFKDMKKEDQDKVYNTLGLTPAIPMPAKGDAKSTTKSAVAPAVIEVRENPNQDISPLRHDTKNALNELGKIFDKKTIEERQALAEIFGKEAFRLAHELPDDGSGRKTAVHMLIGGIMSTVTGTGFSAGAVGAGVNEALINEIKDLDPGTAQIVSAIIGAAAAKTVGENTTAGATAAASGVKNNFAAAVYLIPLFGEAVIIEEGAAIVIAGVTYWAGDWLYEKYYYWKADQEYPPSDEHTTTEDGEGFNPTGAPNSYRDKVNEDGSLVTRRWYDGDGCAYKDVDFANHGNPKRHPKVPHEHTWEWDEAGNLVRN